MNEIKVFAQHAQLFLDSEFDFQQVLADLTMKLLNKKVGPLPLTTESVIDSIPATLPIPTVKTKKKKAILQPPLEEVLQKPKVPEKYVGGKSEVKVTFTDHDIENIQPTPMTLLKGRHVKIICCDALRYDPNPKVHTIGPNVRAIVLSDIDNDNVQVQVREPGFEPYVFSIPRDDVEILNK